MFCGLRALVVKAFIWVSRAYNSPQVPELMSKQPATYIMGLWHGTNALGLNLSQLSHIGSRQTCEPCSSHASDESPLKSFLGSKNPQNLTKINNVGGKLKEDPANISQREPVPQYTLLLWAKLQSKESTTSFLITMNHGDVTKKLYFHQRYDRENKKRGQPFDSWLAIAINYVSLNCHHSSKMGGILEIGDIPF